MVPETEWCVSALIGPERKQRLCDAPESAVLLEAVSREANKAANKRLVTLKWQESCERPGYFRLVAQIPLSETTFDQLFNGRSGYRAQYYLSPEEGILYNREILKIALPALKAANEQKPLCAKYKFIKQSLQAPHSKIWVYQEQDAFGEAMEQALNPPRWVAGGASLGRKAPLPDHHKIDIKGAFINPETDELFVDDLKLDRAWDLFRRGFT